jgi:hypothetical protein
LTACRAGHDSLFPVVHSDGANTSTLALFITASVVGGFGGFAGSVLGGGLGRGALFAGGFIGGVLVSPITAWIAVNRGWITGSAFWRVAAGAAIGFVGAATLAVNTLQSPVGPALATLLTGLGALTGARLGAG